MGGKKEPDHEDVNARILAGLDVLGEYRALGVRFAAERPRASGKIECYAFGREDHTPSAWVDVNTGQYGDSAGSEKATSLWEFAARHGDFPDFRAARKHYAAKSGVSVSGRRGHEDPQEVIELLDWSEGQCNLARTWCAKHKPGTSLPAILDAGGRPCRYPRWRDRQTGQLRAGRHSCLALPAFNNDLDHPVSWVVWRFNGAPFERRTPEGVQYLKMKSCGPTYGTLMNLHALRRLQAFHDGQFASNDNKIECVVKTAGPADMLAVLAAIPADRRDRILVTTNASGETGDVPSESAAWFAGLRVIVVHDRDSAGRIGAIKWLKALDGVAADPLRAVMLPYKMESKHGRDARDFLLGEPADDAPYEDDVQILRQ